jgi:hypothetical protein
MAYKLDVQRDVDELPGGTYLHWLPGGFRFTHDPCDDKLHVWGYDTMRELRRDAKRWVTTCDCAECQKQMKGLNMVYTVYVDGNAPRVFDKMQDAIKYGTSMVYASNKTRIYIRDALDDKTMAQWAYGFRNASIWASERG